MPRIAGAIVPDLPHHITQRGNRRREVFFGRGDYEACLALMRQWCGQHAVRARAYFGVAGCVLGGFLLPLPRALANSHSYRRGSAYVGLHELCPASG